MASGDPAFSCVQPNVPAFNVWRVERLKLRLLPESEHGTFHRGDAYLVYSAAEQTVYGGGRAARGPLAVHIHFWLGSQASPDEAQTASLSAVHLDRLLGGAPVQHREIEGRESPRFLSYFPAGLRLLEGGVGSGLRNVEDGFKPRLFRVVGRRRLVATQAPAVAWAQLSDAGAFVVDAERFVFVWCGRAAGALEKIQAAQLAQALRPQRAGRRVVVVASGEEERLPEEERAAFDAVLPLAGRRVPPAEADGDRDEGDRRERGLSLWRCAQVDGGDVTVERVKSGPLVRGDLVSDDVFVVDAGSVVWVWVGRRAQQEERAEGVRHALAYLEQTGRADDSPLCRVVDGGEPVEFRSLFASWPEPDAAPGPALTPGGVKRAVAAGRFDAAMLHGNRALAAETQLLDDGAGQRQVWRVADGELAPLDERRHGTFFAGDCYVVLYTYRVHGRDRCVVYTWLGAESSEEARETAAAKAAELDDKLGGRAVRARVVQDREPPHFLAAFGGRMVIRDGGEDGEARETFLLQVRSAGRHAARAVEVPCCAASLDSNDAFLLRLPEAAFAWAGRGAADAEREAARAVAFDLGCEPRAVDEGDEPEEFWAALGGRGEYSREPRPAPRPRMPARLFRCARVAGRPPVDEVVGFEQADLCEDDVMLLDAWDAVFVWVGARCGRERRRGAEQAAVEYLRADPAGRGDATPVHVVHQLSEPPTFTGFFAAWDPDWWAAQPSWAAVRREVAADIADVVSDGDGGERPPLPTFPLAALQARRPPEGVDPAHREDYLSEEDFKAALGVTRDEFQRMPQWKKVQKKREASLF